MTREEAKASVLRRLEGRRVGEGDGIVIMDQHTIDTPYGWVFFYNSRAFVETGDMLAALVGQGPVVVVAGTGEIHELGSALPVDEAIAALERQLGLRSRFSDSPPTA